MEEDNSNIITLGVNLIQAYLKRLSDLAHLANLEAKLALKTLVNLTILLFVGILLLLASWCSLLTLLFIYLVSLNLSWLVSAAIVCAVNITLLISVICYMFAIKKYLFFPATRRQISETIMPDKEMDNEQTAAGN
jgi:hypothetical protein